MAMSYTTLVGAKTVAGSIAAWGNSSVIQASAPTILEEAEAYIYQRLHHWRMLKKKLDGVLTVGQDTEDLPADFVQEKTLYLRGLVDGMVYNQLVKNKTQEEVESQFQYDGDGNRIEQTPQIFYAYGSVMQFDSPPDLAYPYQLLYYARPESLSGSNETNWLTIFYPRLVRCACMMGASEFMKDAGMGNYDRTYWQQQTEAELVNAQVESDSQYRSMNVGAYVPGTEYTGALF